MPPNCLRHIPAYSLVTPHPRTRESHPQRSVEQADHQAEAVGKNPVVPGSAGDERPRHPFPGTGVRQGGGQPHQHTFRLMAPTAGIQMSEPELMSLRIYDNAKNHIQNQGQRAECAHGDVLHNGQPPFPSEPTDGIGPVRHTVQMKAPSQKHLQRHQQDGAAQGPRGWAKSIATGNRPQRASVPDRHPPPQTSRGCRTALLLPDTRMGSGSGSGWPS
jgi:hypothetical protein